MADLNRRIPRQAGYIAERQRENCLWVAVSGFALVQIVENLHDCDCLGEGNDSRVNYDAPVAMLKEATQAGDRG